MEMMHEQKFPLVCVHAFFKGTVDLQGCLPENRSYAHR